MTTLKIRITRDILEKSKMCGQFGNEDFPTENCAFALAYRDIFPHAIVGVDYVWPFYHDKAKDENTQLLQIPHKEDAFKFIERFDRTVSWARPRIPEQEFVIDLPDEVIEQIDIENWKKEFANHPILSLQDA